MRHSAAGRRLPRGPVIAGAAPPKMPVEEFKQREVHDAARARLRGLSLPAGPDPKRSRFRGRQAAGLAACSCPQRIGESRWETTADHSAQASFAAIAHNTGQHSCHTTHSDVHSSLRSPAQEHMYTLFLPTPRPVLFGDVFVHLGAVNLRLASLDTPARPLEKFRQ